MQTVVGRGAWMLACLVLGCAGMAAGQDAISSTSTATVSTNLPLTPAGSAASNSVDYSSGGSLPPTDASVSSLSNMTVNSSISASLMSALSSRQSRGKSSASSGAGSSFGVPLTGWGVGSSKSRDSSSQPGQATRVGIARWGVGSSKSGDSGSQPGQVAESGIARSRSLSGQTFSKGSGQALAERRNLTARGDQHSAGTSAPAGQKMGAPFASASMSAGHIPDLSDSQEQSQLQGGGTDKSSGGSYTRDFPDSTKGTAMLSPPERADQMFAFDPMLSTEFPDLADREFLVPSLHVRGPSSGLEKKLDVYQRIEQRLRDYRTESQEKGMQHGKHGSGSISKNPFSSESAGKNGLEKKPSTFGPSY